jgi:hypothetical protein
VLPFHTPGLPETVCPSWGLPEIEGGVMFVGGVGAAATTAVAAESAVVEPAAFVAVTRTRSVEPTSEAPST